MVDVGRPSGTGRARRNREANRETGPDRGGGGGGEEKAVGEESSEGVDDSVLRGVAGCAAAAGGVEKFTPG